MSIQPAISPHLLRVNRVLGGSVNRRIFRAAAIVTFVGVLVKVVATAKEFVVAGIFGRSDAMDAFLIAFLVPGLLVNLFS
jgi:putative peptidoglycan lipid II flippase